MYICMCSIYIYIYIYTHAYMYIHDYIIRSYISLLQISCIILKNVSAVAFRTTRSSGKSACRGRPRDWLRWDLGPRMQAAGLHCLDLRRRPSRVGQASKTKGWWRMGDGSMCAKRGAGFLECVKWLKVEEAQLGCSSERRPDHQGNPHIRDNKNMLASVRPRTQAACLQCLELRIAVAFSRPANPRISRHGALPEDSVTQSKSRLEEDGYRFRKPPACLL